MSSKVTLHRRTSCWGDPPIFYDDAGAIHWALGQGAFATETAAAAAFASLHRLYPDGTWARWLGIVARRLAP
ncbi:MAG: hypothetical protein R3C14_22750 [Caldilineaceae bacterium]